MHNSNDSSTINLPQTGSRLRDLWSLSLLKDSCIATPCSIAWDDPCFPLNNLVNLLKHCVTSYHPEKILISLNIYSITIIPLAPGPGYEVLFSGQRRHSFWTGEGPAALPHYYAYTPWCRVLLEQLTGLQLVKKFPLFHRTRRFITALTSVRHPSLSWASPIQSPHPTS